MKGPIAVPQSHDFTVPRACIDHDRITERCFIDGQAVIARHVEGCRQACKHAAAVMRDRACLAVHDRLGLDDPAAEGFPDRLVAETHPENGERVRCAANDLGTNSGIRWPSRSGRDHDPVRAGADRFGCAHRVIADHTGLCPQLLEVVHEVEGEAVVIVDDQKHRALWPVWAGSPESKACRGLVQHSFPLGKVNSVFTARGSKSTWSQKDSPRPMPRPTLNSAAPAFAGLIAAMAFALGAMAHDAGRRAAMPDSLPVERAAPDFTGVPTRTVFASQMAPATVLEPAAPFAAYQPVIALVIDDVGGDPRMTGRVLALPAPVTVSILPYADDATGIDADARALQHETLIHLPMQPQGSEDPGPDALEVGQDAATMREILTAARARIPGARGFNNHMGSAMTADSSAMGIVFDAASELDLYFLDSVTSPDSVAAAVAEAHGITVDSRDIFIDHVNSEAAVRDQFAAIERLAESRGAAIAIGHPRLLTLDALERWIPEAQARGFRFVALSYVIRPHSPVRTAALDETPGFLGGSH